MLQIPAVLISSGTRTKVTLLSVRSLETIAITIMYNGRLIELCTKVCTITTELYQISTNFTQVHPGEDAHRKIFTLNTHHVYIKLHQYAPISLHLKDSYDLWTVSYSILNRTSTWCPAVRKDNFSSPTATPTVLKLKQSYRPLLEGEAFNRNSYP